MREPRRYRRRVCAAVVGVAAVVAFALPAGAGTGQGVQARDDEFTVGPGETVVVDFLANDDAGQYENVAVVEKGSPLHGAFSGPTLLPTYTPTAGFVGDEIVEYTICGVLGDDVQDACDTARITIHVTGPPEVQSVPPTAAQVPPPGEAPPAPEPTPPARTDGTTDATDSDLAHTGATTLPLIAAVSVLALGLAARAWARRGPISPRRA